MNCQKCQSENIAVCPHNCGYYCCYTCEFVQKQTTQGERCQHLVKIAVQNWAETIFNVRKTRCNLCGHDWDLHHIEDIHKKEFFKSADYYEETTVCDGEGSPCPCVKVFREKPYGLV